MPLQREKSVIILGLLLRWQSYFFTYSSVLKKKISVAEQQNFLKEILMQIDSNFLHRGLKYYYGYDSFRPGQEKIITEILEGRPVLGVLPTGAGKSICFQLPSLMLKGVTLVVSPLISLMKDQAENLRKRGIAASYLESGMKPADYGKVLHEALEGRCKFLYVSPERLSNPQFLDFAQKVGITLLAVDEAHCVSQWGHSFRRDYYNIAWFRKQLPHKPLLAAFTATATPQVRQDILQRLEIEQAKIVVTGFDRPNLRFAVERSQDKQRSLLTYLEKHRDQCGVIYCSTRGRVEQVTELLQSHGYGALRYHAGLTSAERRTNQQAFVEGQVQLIVATNAFGMGIDKADVRFVVHFNMPKDLESYYQEAGRAGRDGLPGECLLLFDENDVSINNYLIESSDSEMSWKAHEKELLQKMQAYCNTDRCLRSYLLNYFGEQRREDCGCCSSCAKHQKSFWTKLLHR